MGIGERSKKYETSPAKLFHVPSVHAEEEDFSDYNNKEELEAALMVLKKIMKMEAAEPFNTPVDPVSLGIPDYF
ncbi:hypothetical protein SUGI_0462950 [Cryptomeria japonica]|nr:hypothetical protein SUGI_0462950 [Cryptomeria japonica]